MPTDHRAADVLNGRPAGSSGAPLSILPAAAVVPAASTVVAIALPAIFDDLAMGNSAIAWLVSGYLLLVAALQPVGGQLGDALGHRRLLLVGSAVLAAAALSAAVAGDPWTLVASRLVQGAAGALIIPSGLAIIRRNLPRGDRGRSVARFLAAMAGGAVLGVVAGGLLVAAFGWRSAFLALAVLAMTALVVAVTASEPPPGSGVLGGRTKPIGSGQPWRGLVAPAGGIALVNLALYVVLVVVPLELAEAGWSSATVGVLLGGLVATCAGGTLTEPALSGRITRHGSVIAGTVTAGMALFLTVNAPAEVAWLAPTLAITGVGLGIAMSALLGLGIDAAHVESAGLTSGLLSTSRYVGSIIGTATLPGVIVLGGHAAGFLMGAVGTFLVPPLVAFFPAPDRSPMSGA